MYGSRIVAVESSIPENIVTNDDLSKIVETSDDWITSRTGIKTRRISLGENTSDMCASAALKVLRKTNTDPKDIDLIIVATITPDSLTPSTACIVQSKIGAKNAFAYDINAACSGFVFALSTADKFIKSGLYKNVLVIGGEALSKMIDWSDRTTCVLFGDGAGCALLKQDRKDFIIAEDLHSDGARSSAIVGKTMPVKNAFSDKEIEEQNYLTMDGREVFNFATKSVPVSIEKLLQDTGLTIDDIAYIVPHQANFRIVEVLAKKLKTDMSKFYLNIDRTGNTSSASIPIALSEMFEKDLIKSGDKIIITGFGAGLTWGSILIEF